MDGRTYLSRQSCGLGSHCLEVKYLSDPGLLTFIPIPVIHPREQLRGKSPPRNGLLIRTLVELKV